MKIKDLKLRNFATFEDYEVAFDGQVTHLVGVNGAGKTTIGTTAIWACLKGIAEKSTSGQLIGERWRFIGPKGPSADVELRLIDEERGAEITVRNHITEGANRITFKAPKGYPINKAWLNSLLNVAFLSAKQFTQLSGKEQALLLGIDTSEYDALLQEQKERYTEINRDLKKLGELEEPEQVDRVSVAELVKEKDEIERHNQVQENRRQVAAHRDENIEGAESRIELLEKELANEKAELKSLREGREKLPVPEPLRDPDPIVEQIEKAEETNEKAQAWEAYCKQQQEREVLEADLAENKRLQEQIQEQRIEHIKEFNFGVDNLSVDDEGQLLCDGRPIREPYFSKGELEMIVARLHASLHPDLKTRFIDDFELLDEENQKQLLDDLLAEGFQVITAMVGSGATGPNVIEIRKVASTSEVTA